MNKRKITSITMIVILFVSLIGVAAVTVTPARADFVTTNDANQVIKYTGTWSYATNQAGYFNTDYHASGTAGDYFEFTFTGATISWVGSTCPACGMADLYMDNSLITTVDLYSPTLETSIGLWAWPNEEVLTYGLHTIKIVVRSDKNTASTGYEVNIDYFKFDDTTPHTDPLTTPNIACSVEGDNGMGYLCEQIDNDHIQFTLLNNDTNHNSATYHLYQSGYVYGKVSEFSMNWSTGGFYPWNTNIHFSFSAVGISCGMSLCDTNTTQLDCGNHNPGQNGTCAATEEMLNEFSTAAGNHFAGAFVFAGQPQGWWSNVNLKFILATVPDKDPCVLQYMTLMSAGPFIIDPTIENPKGPNAVSPDVPDEQIYPTVVGQAYAIRTLDGPWYNGVTDTEGGYSVQFSWDGINWFGLKQQCFYRDPLQPYYLTTYTVAQSTTMYITVADTRGLTPSAFLDNTDGGPPNELKYVVSLEMYTPTMADCSSQFTYDETTDWVASVAVAADVDHVNANVALTPGDWYVLQVASGSWQDGGAPPDRYDGQFSFGDQTGGWGISAPFHTIGAGSDYVYCSTTSGNYATAFVQAGSTNLFLRVGDTALNFANNTGQLGVNVYHATFTRRPDVCELQYGVDNLFGNGTIDAKMQNGVTFGLGTDLAAAGSFGGLVLTPGAWYMLETIDGPWGWVGDTHVTQSYDTAISEDGGLTWTPFADWTGAACNVKVDALGHRRAFFQVPEGGNKEYKIRVNDTSAWYNNIGYMSYNLYRSFDKGVDPGENGGCDYKFDQNAVHNGGYVAATDEAGTYISGIEPNSLYALELLGGTYHWTETGGASGDPLYDVQISDDDGATWHPLPDSYGGVMCYIVNGDNTILFISTGSSYLYKLRVNSSNFSDNWGGMGWNLYIANAGNTIDPWNNNCLSAFSTSVPLALYPLAVSGIQLHMDPKQAEGKPVITNQRWLDDASIVGFAVKITEGPWQKNDGTSPDEHYDAALSRNNGTDWYPIGRDNPDIVCGQLDPLKRYWTAYFKVESNDVWKIRVNDETAADWSNNGGNLWFELYAVYDQSKAAPDCIVDTNRADCLPPGVIIDVNGRDACLMTLTRPDIPTTIDVPEWLGYLSNVVSYDIDALLQWMAWCPQHTSALLNLFDLLKGKEPLATLTELENVIKEFQKQADAYNWDDSEAPASVIGNPGAVNQVMNKMFPAMDGSNPWSGGPLIDLSGGWSTTSYYNSCVANFEDLLGPKLPGAICFVSDEMRETGASFWIQLSLDIGVAFLMLGTIWKDALGLAHFMVGMYYIPPNKTNVTIDLSGESSKPIRFGSGRRGKKWF